ncbi:MarR family winged helix-turn-helix transcriptional regulator [Phenylobacterium montanum]|uniref:MarR family transcriptional regulator n=1 Tax=Phenylobacterium montanum TaxID=2823693 RepID=A0A975G424_9CAUL|nr:MarR family transcriptional regulator [Caulobacter sp. S6]QUD90276.1 MarR family transcriptional regulator [Caulobacter sp. S6]
MSSKLDRIEARLADLAQAHADAPLRDVALLRALNHVSGDFLARMRAALKPYGLTDWSFRTLIMLPRVGDADATPVSMADLALLTGESAPNLTRICDELVRQGLAVRQPSPEDRRKVCLARTPKADAALEATAPDVWGRLEWVMQVLTDEEKALMTGLLKRLAERLETEAGQGSRRRPPAAVA